MTLTEFLLARIAEDEEWFALPEFASEDSAHGEGFGSRGDCPACDAHLWSGTEVDTEEGWWGHVRRRHARVLAECEAKRRIVESETAARAYTPSRSGDPSWDVTFTGGRVDAIHVPGSRFAAYEGEDAGRVYAEWVERNTEPVTDTPTLRLLALPYADHPDYDETWRP